MRAALHYALLTLAGVAGALVIGFAVATVLTVRPGDPALYPPAADEPVVEVFVVYNWQHANLILPASELAATQGVTARALEMTPGEGDWVSLGWGDRIHYRERGGTGARRVDFLRAMAAPANPSVVHIEWVDDRPTPETIGREVLELRLSQEGFRRLAARLDASFALRDGGPAPAGRGRDPQSRFFESVEPFDMFFVCNHWISELLNHAGAPSTPTLAVATQGLAFDLRARAGARRASGEASDTFNAQDETPPAHSGRWPALSPEAERLTGAVRLDSYTVKFEAAGRYQTGPGDLVAADAALAQALDVPRGSLIDIRPVIERPQETSLCGDRPVGSLAFGFRTGNGERYEIAVAAFASDETDAPCGVFQYRQA